MSLLPTTTQKERSDTRLMLSWCVRACVSFTVLAALFSTLIYIAHQSGNRAQRDADVLLKREIGNVHVAADIYGLGVRVGIYLQGASQFLDLIKPRRDGRGTSTFSATACVGTAMLTSWLKLAHENAISAAESVVILCIVLAVIPVSITELIFMNPIGNGLGITFLYLFVLFQACASVWFWTTGHSQMPLLGTRNVTWCLVEVRIDHWFRILAAIIAVCVTITAAMSLVYSVTRYTPRAVKYWRDGVGLDSTEDDMISKRRLNSWISVMGLIFPIAAAEMTIKYNELMPQTDLGLPGQLIPFVLGLATFIDTWLHLTKPANYNPRAQIVNPL